MLTDELLEVLRNLSRSEKLHVMQFIANELVYEEAALLPDYPYDIWSPTDSAEAAAVLVQMLEDDQWSEE